jgi:hypothetical protein
MKREEVLGKLKTISEPLVSLTAFSDGVICDYMSRQGCGGFELFDWNDLDSYNYDSPDRTWDQVDDEELEEWMDRFDSGDFHPLASISADSLADEFNRLVGGYSC